MNGVSVEGMEEFKVQSPAIPPSRAHLERRHQLGDEVRHQSDPRQRLLSPNRKEVFNARGFTFTPTSGRSSANGIPEAASAGQLYIPKVFDGRNKAFFFLPMNEPRPGTDNPRRW